MFLTFHSNYNIILIYLYSRLIGLDFNLSLFLSAGVCGFLPDLDNIKELLGLLRKDKIGIYDHIIFDGLYDDEGIKWLWPLNNKFAPVLIKVKFHKWSDYFKKPGVLFFEFIGLAIALFILSKTI